MCFLIKLIYRNTTKYAVLGFDCEWVTVNNERRKVALLQLATSEGLCALFRLCRFPSIPQELRALLEDPKIIKTGVACTEDGHNLLQDYSIKVNGTFDLRFLALLASHKAEGLARLSKNILNIELTKNWRITCSDWEAPVLTPEQIDYAAKDAFVAVEIFKKLYKEIRPNDSNNQSILQFCDNYTDISFKQKLAQLNLDMAEEQPSEKQILNVNKRQKDINKILRRAYTTRNKPLYDNCYLEAPDGVLLCTIDKRKAEWYIKKGLGIEICNEPLRVRLNFEPAGRSNGEVGEYYTTEKENRCVVCGKENELIRKNVVPHEYRKFFPNVMKDKTSHDILLLCTHCHHHSNISDLKIRRMLAEKCNAPIYQLPDNDDELKHFRIIQKSARALVKSSNSIPEARKIELMKVMQDAYPKQIINDDFLQQILKKKEPESCIRSPHGQLVVDFYKENGGIILLEKLFRQHFLDSMNPKFMPKLWNVNHNANRLGIRALENRVNAEDLKFAGVDEKMIESLIPQITISQSPPDNYNDDDETDNVSVLSFYSASGIADNTTSRGALSGDDERYFSDTTTIGSYYESCANSIMDPNEFQSFDEPTEKEDNYSDTSTIGSDNDMDDFSSGSDTEIEEEIKITKK